MATEGFFDRLGGGVQKAFANLYGGPQDPRATPEQYQDALRSGLTQGGLAMMVGGGQPNNDFLSLLAQGMIASQQGVALHQQNALQMQNQQELATLAQGPPSADNLGRMMMSAIGGGNMDAARVISEVLKSHLASGRTAATRPRFIHRTEEDGQRYQIAVDPFTGQEMFRNPVDRPASAISILGNAPNTEGEMRDSTETRAYNRVTGRFEETLYDNPERPRSEAEGRAASFIVPLQVNLPILDSFEENPLPLEGEMFRNFIAGNFSSERARKLYGAAIPITEAWLRQTTGAAYNDTEYANAALLFIPRAGDSPDVLMQKRKMRSALYIMTKERSGARLTADEQSLKDSLGTGFDGYLANLAQQYAQDLESGMDASEAAQKMQESAFGGEAFAPPDFNEWKPGGGV